MRKLVFLILCTGCIAYQPRPVSVAENADALLSRSLDPSRRWTPEQLRTAALELHPDLAVARAELASAQAAIRAATERPNPTLSAGVEHKGGSGDVSPWVTTLSLDLPFETAGKRGARIREATALSNEAAANVDQAIWTVRSDVSRAIVDLARNTSLRAAREHEATLREEIVAIYARRLEVGESASPDLFRVRAEQRVAAAISLAEAAKSDTARDALATAIGIPRAALPNDIDLAHVGDATSPRDEASLCKLALTARPDVLAALAHYDALDATYRLEVKRQYPDFHVSPGIGWDQGAFKWTLGAAAELPIFNRHEGPIARAEAERAKAAAQLLAVQAKVIGTVDAARTRERTARARLAAASQVVESREALVAAGRKQFAAGEIDRLAMRQLEAESAAAEADRVDARFDVAAALVELEAAIEQPLGGER
ncbi:MAG: TolC family protein [Acidobacteria bacterium]|nr:TolC family protein [Acidobacteriota bacterium]